MEAIILAGGFGTRLQSVVKDVPKPMADINGRPFLAYLFDYAISNGVERVVLSVGYKREVIERYFGNSYKGAKIEYCVEDSPLGTGGAIKMALGMCMDKNTLVLNGDTFFAVNLSSFADAHNKTTSLVSLALKPMECFDRYGCVALDGDTVVSFEEKKYCDSGLINGGVYLLNRDILPTLNCLPDIFSFEKDFLESKIADIRPYGFIDNGYFIDIGIPEDYERAKEELNDYIQDPS